MTHIQSCVPVVLVARALGVLEEVLVVVELLVKAIVVVAVVLSD